MALYASVGLAGLGYVAAQDYGELQEQAIPGDQPSQSSIYESTYSKTARAEELNRGTAMWNASQSPLETGVVPRPAYADMFSSVSNSSSQNGINTINTINTIRAMSGENLQQKEFTHNNMQPFFGGRMRQNMREDVNEARLETFTGTGGQLKHKKETACFFQPTAGNTNICGMADAGDFYQQRIQAPIIRNNDFPIEPVRVGPGLNQGYSAQPIGGFQQADTLDFMRPKSVDELRTLSNPKTTYSVPVAAAPGSLVSERPSLPNVAKNKSDTFYEQSPSQWFTTTGAQTKEFVRPVTVVKPTSRLDSHVEYYPSTVAADGTGIGIANDYGRATVTVYANERDTTTVNTVVGGLTSIVKAIIAPFTDIARHNIREFFVDSAREFGNPSVQMPEKATLYDSSDHVTRTTIKETTIHDAINGNLTKAVPDSYVASDDPARTTNKETTIHDSINGNLTTAVPDSYMATDDTAKTTLKETTIHDAINGNLTTAVSDSYMATDDIAKTTIKETMIHDAVLANIATGHSATYTTTDQRARTTNRETIPLQDDVRNVNMHTYKAVVYNADAVAKKTHRETMEDSKCGGFVDITNKNGAYSHIKVNVDPTQRQFISDYEYYGSGKDGTDFRPPTGEAEAAFRTNTLRERIDIDSARAPTASGEKNALPKEGLNMATNKPPIKESRYAGNVNATFKQNIVPITECETTRLPTLAVENSRIDADILTAFHANPFTKPLTSVA